ncbi:MAG: methyltransferase domain-containing protein [Limisphaerales bacterium]
MADWNAQHYLKFGDERTRAAVDLVARIKLESPKRIVDLGCGPGNSTELLWTRWPEAKVSGLDSSSNMIEAANAKHPGRDWRLGDLASWSPEEPVELVFSNAAIQWVSDHGVLMKRMAAGTAEGGAVAFQIPSGTYATVRNLMHEISQEDRWNNDRMEVARGELTMESPEFYYDALTEGATSLDVWESEYHHVMESTDAIVDWISSTGLRPFVAALGEERERTDFVEELKRRVSEEYEIRTDGRVLFPFRRTFVIA